MRERDHKSLKDVAGKVVGVGVCAISGAVLAVDAFFSMGNGMIIPTIDGPHITGSGLAGVAEIAVFAAGVAGVIAGKKVLDRISSRNPQQTP